MLAAGWSEHHSTVQGTLSSLSGQPFYLQGHPTMCDVMRMYVCVACLLYIYLDILHFSSSVFPPVVRKSSFCVCV